MKKKDEQSGLPVTESHSPPDSEPAGPNSRRRFSKRNIISAAVLLVLCGAGVGIYLGVSGGSSAAAGPGIVTTDENVSVTTGTMKETVSASGTLDPADDDDFTFAVSGTVNKVYVTTGEKVTDGQTLATIDSTALSDQLSSDEATLTSDKDKLTTDTDDDAATSTIDTDNAQITSAESQVSTAETDLSDATLKSTFSGTVASVDLSVGTAVSGSGGTSGGSGTSSVDGSSAADNSSSNTSASSSSDGITVVSSNSFTLSTTVDDTEVSEVKVGDQAVITPSDSTTEIYGTVASVSLIASSDDSDDSSVAEFPVVIDVTGSPSGIYAGDSATASVIVKEIQDAIEVPTAAISYTGGQATVTEVVDGSDKTVSVTTGLSVDNETQITSGLKAGDSIVERVVKFSTSGGSARTLFGGSGSSSRPNFTGGGSPPSGGTGGFGGSGFGGAP